MGMLVRKRGMGVQTPVLRSFGAAHTATASFSATMSLTLLSALNASEGAVGDLIVGFATCDGGRTIATASTGVARAWFNATDPAIAVFRYVQPNTTQSQIASLTNGGSSEDWVTAKLGARFAETDESKWVYGTTTTASGSSFTVPQLTAPDSKPYIWVGIISTSARGASGNAPSGWEMHTAQTGTLSMNAGLTVIYKVAEAASMTFPSVAMSGSVTGRMMSLAIPGAEG